MKAHSLLMLVGGEIKGRSESVDNNFADYDQYMRKLKDELKDAMLVVQANSTASQQWQYDYYNKDVKGSNIKERDYVLLANKACG
ncbi:hypothetical protein QTP70_029183 [Hemibagrus guttatus]|uniref:Uncharacterized protein n=1 Tax=Hemibagrus guttatus TaxID=175788 RepID=A0AAE0R1E6_9TELE|nr:hypothetical protein QTP70_029183 [Hemibagrus guttatus]